MKRLLPLLLTLLLLATLFVGCSSSSPSASPGNSESPSNSSPGTSPSDSGEPAPSEKTDLKVGMVTDSGSVDDKSFNQSAWEGIKAAAALYSTADPLYLKPASETPADYSAAIQNLYDNGCRLIVCPGFLFSPTIYEMQDKLPDCKFLLIDETPHTEDYSDFKTASNTVSVVFAEHESGFLAGLAAALKIQDGNLGFVGGMQVPAVERFNWGFQQGVKYANDTYGTTCAINPDDVVYQGTFNDSAAGGQLAKVMYDRGVKVVFGCGGITGNGALYEAAEQRTGGKEVWAVGVDTDQYDLGLYGAGNDSAVLTSAMKGVRQCAYDITVDFLKGEFTGGRDLTYNAASDGVGIPEQNPNLGSDITDKVADAFAKMKDGSLVVSNTKGDLIG
ncbi:MAG: BMP family ABC transporter substrate-binding protein [Oscillospiraceae bacterium]|jgi:basic membrane protein A|nr:BMP family ABC transporter substrate-binding protein [Oscillospiraceae bacterium]